MRSAFVSTAVIWTNIPQKNIGAFVVVTRSPLTRFKNMSDGINDLVTELSGNKPLVIPAS